MPEGRPSRGQHKSRRGASVAVFGGRNLVNAILGKAERERRLLPYQKIGANELKGSVDRHSFLFCSYAGLSIPILLAAWATQP